MDKEKEIVKRDGSLGSIRIADEVVSIIAGLAATEVDGIAGMSGGIAGGIAEMLGRKNFAKGVKVEVGEKEAAVDLYIIVKYGVRIPDVALAAQENVKQVKAETDAENIASQKVLCRSGFVSNGKMGEEGPRFVYGGKKE